VVQALFFADGGLLALGSNIINLGAVTCFLAYPLVFRPMVGQNPGRLRLSLACLFSAVFGLQLGAFGVVAETALSGMADLPFASFLLLMQPIHLLISLVEGLVTAAVVAFIWKVRPDALRLSAASDSQKNTFYKQLLVPLLVATLVCGGLLSGFASTEPDGLEWAMERAAESDETSSVATNSSSVIFEQIQEEIALFPNYSFRDTGEKSTVEKSVSGLVGGFLTLFMIILGGSLLGLWQRWFSQPG